MSPTPTPQEVQEVIQQLETDPAEKERAKRQMATFKQPPPVITGRWLVRLMLVCLGVGAFLAWKIWESLRQVYP